MAAHVFNIRVTVVRWDGRTAPGAPRGTLCVFPALAIWEGRSRNGRRGKVVPNETRWHEADPETGKLCTGGLRSGTVRRDDLGVTWCRGWRGPDVDALLAAAALMC